MSEILSHIFFLVQKLKPQVSARSFPPDSIRSTSGKFADEMSGGGRGGGGVLSAQGANAASKVRVRRACLLAQCAGRRAVPSAVSPARTACSRAGYPDLGGDPSR